MKVLPGEVTQTKTWSESFTRGSNSN